MIPRAALGRRGGKLAMGLVLATASSLAFGATPIVTKLVYRSGVTPLQLFSLRFVLSTVVICPLALSRRGMWPGRKQSAVLLLLGLSFGLQSFLFFTALFHLAATTATLVFFAYPLVVIGWSLTVGRVKPRTGLIGVLVANIVGLLLVINPQRPGSVVSVISALLSAILYAVYVLVNARLTPEVDAVVSTLYVNAGAAIFWLLAAAIAHSVWVPAGARDWSAFLYLALMPSLLGVAFLTKATEHLGARLFSLSSTSEPVFTMILAAVVLGTALSATQYVGAALVVLSAVGAARIGF